MCVASPGISEFSEFFGSARAASVQIMGEPEFAWRLSPQRWCGITGTNGKTTTTSLTQHLLRSSGMAAFAVGNIGMTAISAVDSRSQGDWLVAELSSYQLATTCELHPRVSVLLNITPDHLAWHRSHDNYARAKISLFKNMDRDDLAIVDVEDDGINAYRDQIFVSGRRVLSVSFEDPGTADAAFVRDGVLTVRLADDETSLVSAGELKIFGHHNVINALAALLRPFAAPPRSVFARASKSSPRWSIASSRAASSTVSARSTIPRRPTPMPSSRRLLRFRRPRDLAAWRP